MLLFQTCNIYNELDTLVDGNTTTSRASVYSWIKCKFWKNKSKTFGDSVLWRETDSESMNLVIEWDKNLVRKWYLVDIIWETTPSQWIYKIESIDENHSVASWLIDNFYITLFKYND